MIKTVDDENYNLWEPFDADDEYILVSGNGSLLRIKSFNSDACELWNELDYNWLPELSDDDDVKDNDQNIEEGYVTNSGTIYSVLKFVVVFTVMSIIYF